MPRITLRELGSDKLVSCPQADALIGRDPSSALPVDGPNARVVSGQHARIFFQDASWWIQDMSRNGTVLDRERLIKGVRHALRVGQVIGLGDSGPRLRVETLEARLAGETALEPDFRSGTSTEAPRRGASLTPAAQPAIGESATAALRPSERGGLRLEEATEPMKPAPDWVVQLVVRMTHTNQTHEARGEVIRTGRSPDCAVQIPPELGASVSRIHAEIAIQDGGVTIRDAGSRNGTFVNGARVAEPQPARVGDVIMLGPGGPTFTIEELRIVKGEQPAVSSGTRHISTTSLSREPDTEPPVEGSAIGRVLRGLGRVFGRRDP